MTATRLDYPTWRQAMTHALYGPAGFYRRPAGPNAHFRTSVSASPLFAEAVLALLVEVDASLGHPPTLDFVDMGAGHGQLLTGVLAIAPAELRDRLRLTGVEVAARPEGLPEAIAWTDTPHGRCIGLIVANEYLDNVPLDIAMARDDGTACLVEVDPATGRERSIAPEDAPDVGDEDLAWLARWCPALPEAGDGVRVEIGRTRDEAWVDLLGSLRRGVAVAIDYSTGIEERSSGVSTLTAYQDGRLVPPVANGTCDLTAAVALDACREAGSANLGPDDSGTLLLTQRDALRRLGIRTPHREPGESESTEELLRRLTSASAAAELLDPDGLGGYEWLVQAVCTRLPTSLLTDWAS